jgi:hypothetical protein
MQRETLLKKVVAPKHRLPKKQRIIYRLSSGVADNSGTQECQNSGRQYHNPRTPNFGGITIFEEEQG